MDPFLLFPEEVWEMILHQVEDSRDVRNIFRAFPRLDLNSNLQKKKHLWLFGLIIPHIIPCKLSNWINETDLLNCRVACRHWSIAVDHYLQNQSQLKAYHPESQDDNEVFYWDTKTHLVNYVPYGHNRDKPNHLGGTYFQSFDYQERKPKSLPMFLKAMEDANYPLDRCPFLSKSLSIMLPYATQRGCYERSIVNFYNDTIIPHQKYGSHVWFYEIGFYVDYQDLYFMIRCLSYLPNLRHLHLVGYEEVVSYPKKTIDEMDQLIDMVRVGLPSFPYLETLRIHTCPKKLGHLLITTYSKQVRRLEMEIVMWRGEYTQIFPNLTELELTKINDPNDWELLNDLLSSIEAPQLAKLQLKFQFKHRTFSIPFGKGKDFVIEDIFKWLKRFSFLSP